MCSKPAAPTIARPRSILVEEEWRLKHPRPYLLMQKGEYRSWTNPRENAPNRPPSNSRCPLLYLQDIPWMAICMPTMALCEIPKLIYYESIYIYIYIYICIERERERERERDGWGSFACELIITSYHSCTASLMLFFFPLLN